MRVVTALAILLILFVSGCAKNMMPISRLDLEKSIKNDYKEMGYVSYSDLISDDKKSRDIVEYSIRKEQCFFVRPNPMLISSMSKMDLILKGVITASGQIKIAAQPEGSLGITSQTEQTIPWPITVVSLSAVPDMYLSTKLGRINEYKDIFGQFDNVSKREMLEQYYSNYKKLNAAIKELQESFDVSKHCSNK